MTTRYKADDLSEGLTGTIHETGHALYEQARPAKYAGQPVSSAHSMGIHESQSLLWERMVALGPEFAKFLLPKLGEQFGGQFEGVTPEQLHASFNIVKKPSLIRVESDELTYPLHIILRYELECGLIDGSIEVDDLPRLWNEKMETMLGCTPPDDAKGVLQDVHWSAGAFGYEGADLLMKDFLMCCCNAGLPLTHAQPADAADTSQRIRLAPCMRARSSITRRRSWTASRRR